MMIINRLVTWITFLAVFAMAARVSVDTDTWWHLRAGQYILENQTIPQTDPFSHTRAGEPWQYPGWLVEAPMTLIYNLAGPGGLNLFTAGMVTLAFFFIWLALSGGTFLRAFVIVLAAAASGVYWAARPYLMTFLLAAVYLWILESNRWQRSAASKKRLWLLPLLMILWVNSHGGFAVGFILWGVYWFSDLVAWLLDGSLWGWMRTLFKQPLSALRQPELHLTWIGLLMLLVICINPSGPIMLAYPFKTVSIGALTDYIQEWQSPDFHLPATQPFIWLVIAILGAVGISRRRIALTDFLLFSGFFYMSLMAGRNIALFALAAPLALTRHTAPVLEALGRKLGFRMSFSERPTRLQNTLNWAILLLLVLAVAVKAASVYPRAVNERYFNEALPVEAIAYIKDNLPPGQMFNSYNWGGYLLWSLPEYPVFIDGRTDLYSDGLIDEWLQVVRAEDGWQQVLNLYDVRLILLEPHMPVVGVLEDEGWRELYQDEKSVVYGR